jgi:hypothetical protein
MKRVIATLAVTLAVAAAGVGSAFAGTPVEASGQSASNDQAALASSDAVQVDPSNQNLAVRVLSPGSDGTVNQTNSDASSATAGNTATTTQNATQSQPGCGCLTSPTAMTQAAQTGDVPGVVSGAGATTPSGGTGNADPQVASAPAAAPAGVQSSDQTASTDQTAAAGSSATQVEPQNQNISVRVLSPGDDGSVSQTNGAASSASAGNTATTSQTDAQSQGGSGVQSSDQTAETDQTALAGSEAKQIDPSNSNISVRVLSPGNGGDVSQTNSAASSANAGNTATTTQGATQDQGTSCGCGGKTGPSVQSSDQKAGTDQTALAGSEAKQIDPSNSNISVRVLSPGNGGDVTQTNSAASSATAGNTATTSQTDGQSQGGSGVQSSDQKADTGQTALAGSKAEQLDPSNDNESIRIASKGDGGSVSQTNSAASSANAGNTATTTQGATQDQGTPCGCGGKAGPGVQASVQEAETDQTAVGLSEAKQIGAENSNDPVRIWSPGEDGDVSQTNSAASSANAGNTATTTQTAGQDPSSPRCSCSCGCSPGTEIQAAGQVSSTSQLAVALSEAKQIGAENTNDPVRIWSPGNDGNVSQTNSAASSANAGNTASTTQDATQNQGTPCACGGLGVQAIGQWAETDQAALAASGAVQLPGRSHCGCEPSSGNSAGPVRIWSPGTDGNVTQTNSAASSAGAGNMATTTQSGLAGQGLGCGCSGLQIQALGQLAGTLQRAAALSLAFQAGPANELEPVRVGSWGGGGSTSQSNGTASSGSAGNTARTSQTGRLMV